MARKKRSSNDTNRHTTDFEPPKELSTETDSSPPVNPSRIFVRNLPPSITEADFASHIHKHRGSAITDVRLLPRRRIAYVGYQTPQDAESAVKYFNKSFIRMSRILVELARDVTRLHVVGEGPTPVDHTTGGASRTKPAESSKLNEYLELRKLNNPKKRTRETLDDQSSQIPNIVENKSHGQKSLIDDHHEHQEPARKKTKPDDGTADQPDRGSATTGQEEPIDSESQMEENPQPTESSLSGPISDSDWMRSRTTRLLGLVEESDGEVEDNLKAMATEQKGSTEPKSATMQQPTPPEDQSDENSTKEIPQNSTANKDIETIEQSARLFLRNLSYTVREDDLRDLFSAEGPLSEVHIPIDSKTNKAKGMAFVQFEDPQDAIRAFRTYDGVSFQGRLLHVLPGAPKRSHELTEFEISKLPLKQQKLLQRKFQAASAPFNWNFLYMNADAVVASIASKLGVQKSEILDPTSSDAAIKQAQAETSVIQETKKYMESQGINIDSFNSRERSDNPILVKNFSFGTTNEELKELFGEFGEVRRILVPPSGTMAFVEYDQDSAARTAFKSLAYRRFKDSILYLEKTPKNMMKLGWKAGSVREDIRSNTAHPASTKTSGSDLLESNENSTLLETSTLFVRNLNFTTTNTKLHDTFRPLDGFLSARVMTKQDPSKPGRQLSMGYGFVEFKNKENAQAALAAMNGHNLEGHQLLIKASHKGLDAAEERRREDRVKRQKDRKSKLIVKNLPFQATKKDVRGLLASYGQLRTVRVPKKFDGTCKGFAFAEFTTPREAENAMDALRNTHLLGRRLVLEYASGDAEDPEEEIKKMQQKVERQTNNLALQRLTAASERKKFDVHGPDDEE